MKRVFDNTDRIDGNAYEIYLAPRPDIVSCVKASGMLEDDTDVIDWMYKNGEKVREILGEEYVVTVSVNIE